MVRCQTILSLAELQPPQLLERLAPLLSDPSPEIRPYVIRALATSGQEAAERLEPFVQDPDETIRQEAIKALGTVRNPRALPLLVAIAGTPDAPEKKSLSGPGGMTFCAPSDREVAIQALGDFGELALDTLRRLWAEGDVRTRRAIIRAVSVIDGPQARAMITTAIKDNDPAVRGEALEALQFRTDSEAQQLLCTALREDPNDGVKFRALEAVWKFLFPWLALSPQAPTPFFPFNRHNGSRMISCRPVGDTDRP